ncbi:MAG: hypothetical protein H6709_01855 [Kofleriaceae bacterium]|nr:hypothetical protein [Kofleriaceae bacterium]
MLSAGARLLASPTSARWRELCAAVAAVPGLRLAAREVAALPVGFRDVVGWALRVLAGADAAAVADPDALTTLLDDGAAGRGEVPEGVLTTLVAAVFPPGRSRGAATVDELSPIERGVLRLLADADPYDEAPFAAVVAAGLPTSWLDDYAVSRVRAVRSYLGVEPPDGYRVVVAGTVAGRRVAWPAFRWAHRVIAGEVPATAFGAAVGAAPRATRIAIATALSVPPADLAAAPGYDRRRLHAVLVDALDVDRATRVAAVARLGDPDVELAGGAALPLLAIAAAVAPDDIDGDAAGYRLGMPRLPGTVEVVREVVGALRGAALAGALDRLGTDEPEAAEPGDGRDDDEDDDDGPGDIDGWDVLDLAEDREDRAARAVAAIRTWDDPPAAAAAARVLQALRGLCPEVVPVIARALADGARPWDGVLRAVTATAARRRPAKLAPRRMRRGPAAR